MINTTTTQDNHYASAHDTASVIRTATADEAWLHAQLDRLDPHRLEAGGAGDTPALIKLVFELRADAERYRALRAMAVRLSLPHETISMLVTNQGELDAAMKETP